MKKLFILSTLLLAGFCSCKKDYTCECADNNGVYATYKVHNTKKKADAECDDYCTSCKFNAEGACTLK